MSGFGGFGKAPAGGGFGAAKAPAATGFGAKAPAAGGDAKAPAAAWGSPKAGGAAADAKAPAWGAGAAKTDVKAPAWGAGGAKAEGKAPAWGSGGGTSGSGSGGGWGSGTGAKAPGSAWGASGTGAGAKKPEAPPADPAMMGPGFTPQGSSHWAMGCDLAVLHDGVLYEDLPEPVQHHLKVMNAFFRRERQASKDIRAIYSGLLSGDAENGHAALARKLDVLADGEGSVTSTVFDIATAKGRVDAMSNQLQSLQQFLTSYRSRTFDPIRSRGAEHWAHGHNAGEGPSVFFADTVARLGKRVNELVAETNDLESALHPGGNRSEDPSRSLVEALDASITAIVSLGDVAARVRQKVDRVGDMYSRQFGEAAAHDVFALRRDVRKPSSGLLHASKKMGYDPQAPGATPPAATTTAGTSSTTAAAGGGFGGAKAPATGGWGAKAPASADGKAPATGGGFGAAAKAPEGSGDGAGKTAAAGGFGAAKAPAAAGGFGAAKAPAAAGGFGAAKAPAAGGFGGAAAPKAPAFAGFGKKA